VCGFILIFFILFIWMDTGGPLYRLVVDLLGRMRLVSKCVVVDVSARLSELVWYGRFV
jgi:hypothetical protein